MVQIHAPAPSDDPPIPGAVDLLRHALEQALERERPAHGESWLLAFSGGPDSTALAAALAPLARERGMRLFAVHVDHGTDPGSAARAAAAATLADRLGLDFQRGDSRRPGGTRARREPGGGRAPRPLRGSRGRP